MTVYEYTALKNPYGSKAVVEEYGMQAVPNPKGLGMQLAECVKRDGQRALDKIADVHPDLPLFQSKIDTYKKSIKEKYSGFSNADGQAIKNEISDLKNQTASANNTDKNKGEILMIGGIVLIGLALVLKLK